MFLVNGMKAKLRQFNRDEDNKDDEELVDNDIESNNLEAYISFVRRKLRSIGSNAQIKAIRGLGYKLEI